MTRKKDPTEASADLRRRAETKLGRRRNGLDTDDDHGLSDAQRLVHELQVHQIELELQNEELQRARAEMEDSLTRYADLYEFAPVGYLTLDRKGAIQQLNLTAARLLGQERSRLLGGRFGLRVDVDSRADFNAFIEHVFERRTQSICDLLLCPAGAAALTVQLTAAPSQDGQECRLVVTDITARKRAEELIAIRLRLQEFAVGHSIEELLQKALDEAEQLTGSTVGFYHFVEADRHALSLQAWSTRTLALSPIPQERGRLLDVDKTGVWADCLLRRRAVIHNDAAVLRHGSELPNGHAIVTRELLVPLFRNGGTVAIIAVGNAPVDFTADDISTVACVGDVAWDLVERKRAEREREQLHSQLAHAQKMEAIGTLAGGVAHDFNNILHGILGGLTMLELHKPNDDGTSYIQEMKALVERGAELARQLLGFARRGKYDVEPLDLGSVLQGTSDMFGRTRKDVRIELDVAPGLRRVLMDHTQLEQVLLNLLVNAGQAMPEGGRLRLRADNAELAKTTALRHGVEPGPFIKLIVADTGAGMDSTTQARIFEPFFTTKGAGQGTGLGLASVYGIVTSHGGFITVESQLKMGTTFTLFLPATSRTPSFHRLQQPLVVRGAGTILVVDDEDMILRVCSRVLQGLGYEVLTAGSGREGIELVRKHGSGISLVILDMVMPDMSGRQTFEVLQQIEPGIKVLLASGYSMEGQARDLLAHGCCGFIQKPFGTAVLSAKLQEILCPPATDERASAR